MTPPAALSAGRQLTPLEVGFWEFSRYFHFVPAGKRLPLLHVERQTNFFSFLSEVRFLTAWCRADTPISLQSAPKSEPSQAIGHTPLPAAPFLTLRPRCAELPSRHLRFPPAGPQSAAPCFRTNAALDGSLPEAASSTRRASPDDRQSSPVVAAKLVNDHFHTVTLAVEQQQRVIAGGLKMSVCSCWP